MLRDPRGRPGAATASGRWPRTWRCLAATGVLLLLPACSSDGGGPTPPVDTGPGPAASIAKQTGDAQSAIVASALPAQPTVLVRDAGGRAVPGVNVVFAVTAGGGWVTRETVTTDNAGSASTTWYTGPAPGADHRLRASAAGSLQVEFTATASPLVPGTTYSGANQYVEYIAGDMPLIVSASHGGTVEPASIPDRTGNVTTVRDANTEELARDIHDAFRSATGGRPHVIIMRLHRRKIDANREIVEAAQGNPEAERAWREFHGYIEAARAAVVASQRRGLIIDLHGHGHEIQRLELGYRLSASDLAQPDEVLNTPTMIAKSSMRAHVHATGETHAAVIRGGRSFGTLFELAGYPSVPSQQQPHPGGAPYFTGGYITDRHASADGNAITGFQLEANMTGVRNTQANRQRFAEALVAVVGAWDPLLTAGQGQGQGRGRLRVGVP